MSRSDVVPYKDLQKEAKKCGIPANMKRQFLESALEAFAENNQSRIQSIIEFHKNARKRRNVKPVKDILNSKNKKIKPNPNIVVQLSDIPQEDGRLFDLTGDEDDCSNFHPDSTSTPKHQSLSGSQTDIQRNVSPVGAFSNLNVSRLSYEPKHDNLASHFKSAPALMPRNPTQDLFVDDINIPHSSYCHGPALRTPYVQQSQSQICLYDNANYNFSHESYYSSQLPLNPRYYESNGIVPVSEMVYPRNRNSTFVPHAAGNECSSYLPNVPQLNDLAERSSTVTPWPQNFSFGDNGRTKENTVNCKNVVQDDCFTNCFNNKGTDNGSISAEFDSNSDTESLSLPDEIANFFDSEFENRKKSPSSFPIPFDYHPKPNVQQSDMLQSLNFESKLPFINNGEHRGATDAEKSQDSGVGSLPLQTIMPGSDWSFDNHNLLPSITTLLPDYNMSAYCQAYMKPSKPTCGLNPMTNNYPSNQFIKSVDKMSFPYESRNTDNGSQRYDSYENNYSKNYTIPYLTSNTSQSNNSMLKSYLGNKSSLPINESFLSEESSISSSVVEDLPASNLLNMLPFNVFNEAMQEMQNCNKKSTIECCENGLVTRNGTSSEQKGTCVVYKRETISIQNTLIEKNVKKDVYCKSLEIQMKKPAENIQVSTMCESTTQVYGENSSRSSFRCCKNKIYGCVAMLRSNECLINAHENECIYQVVHCPLDKCDWCDIMKTLTAHVYESHRSDLRMGKDLVYVVNRPENEDTPFITYFQVYEGTVFVITLHINEKKCIATMQYIPEMETTDYRNKRINALMHLIYFPSNEVESRCWEGVVQPYLESDETLFQKDNTLQSTIGNSQNLILRVLIF